MPYWYHIISNHIIYIKLFPLNKRKSKEIDTTWDLDSTSTPPSNALKLADNLIGFISPEFGLASLFSPVFSFLRRRFIILVPPAPSLTTLVLGSFFAFLLSPVPLEFLLLDPPFLFLLVSSCSGTLNGKSCNSWNVFIC